MLPSDTEEILTHFHVISLKLHRKFRNITQREIALWKGPSGWAEFSPFLEYGSKTSLPWFLAACEASHGAIFTPGTQTIKVNGTIPAVEPKQVAQIMQRFKGVGTFKVKVAQQGQTLHDDINRIAAVRALAPEAKLRLDANGGWTFEEAVTALDRLKEFQLEYLEQPVAQLADLKKLRSQTEVMLAADESIRLAKDATQVIEKDAADVLILKVAPLGGIRQIQKLAALTDKKIVISSALESSVGMYRGALAASLVSPDVACGLGTVELFEHDICTNGLRVNNGRIQVQPQEPSASLLEKYAVDQTRKKWWIERIKAVHELALMAQ